MDLQLTDKIVLVTGAGSGIGRAVANAFAGEGACLAVVDRNRDAGQRTTDEILAAGGQAIFIAADIARAVDVRAMIDATVEHYGRLDVAINNAGVPQPFTPLHETSDETFSHVVAVNLSGTFSCLRAEIAAMLATGGGAIVNVASIAAFTGSEGVVGYNATKHAIVGLTRTAALEYAQRGIRVNAVAPGTIETAMVEEFVAASGDPAVLEPIRAAQPIGRLGRPEEVTGAVLYLASDQASFTTGHTLVVDGGFTAR